MPYTLYVKISDAYVQEFYTDFTTRVPASGVPNRRAERPYGNS
jgi:hypothetical protein